MERISEASVRSIERGMRVLSEVSRHKGVRPAEVAKALGIPRPTVYRILSSLEALGYVKSSSPDNRFRVTIKTRAIADGYDDETIASEFGSPAIQDLQSEIVWPVDLLTYEDGVMVVRESTLSKSPMAIDRNMIGTRGPVLRTAAGRAWLAFSPDKEREICLNMLRLRNDPDDIPFLEQGMLDNLLNKCREVGYGMRLGEKYIPKTSSIAMPVKHNDQIIACLSVIWITSAMSYSQARETLVGPMKKVVLSMENNLPEGLKP